MERGEYYRVESGEAERTMAGFPSEEKLRRIGRRRFEDFFAGVQSIYQIIDRQEDAKVVIAPWRGSAPIVWGLEAIAKHEGKELPLIVTLPIGTSVTSENPSIWGQKGLTGLEKMQVTRSYMKTLDELYGAELRKKGGIIHGRKGGIVLLDEANTGGTISQAAAQICFLLKNEFEWATKFAIVMAHTNHGDLVRISHRAEKLLSNVYGTTHKVTLPLFFMDMREILPWILRQDPGLRTDAVYEPWELLEVVDNPNARDAIQSRCRQILAVQNRATNIG